MTRQCGECTLCCKLVPVAALNKKAGERCAHQRWGKGCAIYVDRPNSCRQWSCAWLSESDTAALSRPDRSHCVIDELGTRVAIVDHATGGKQHVPAVQIWCDPQYPHAYLHPTILAFMRRRGLQQLATIVRYNNEDAIFVVPPELHKEGVWVRYASGKTPLAPLAGCLDVLQGELINQNMPCGLFEFDKGTKTDGV